MNAPAPITAERWRLRASDFELLFEAGALGEVRRAELIDGDIYGMSPQATRHSRAKTRLAAAIADELAAIGSDLEAFVEVSVIVAANSVPEPDIAVSTYKGNHFMPADTVALVIEVSDTTLAIDLGRKADLYAGAGIPEYWVVDLAEHRVLMHADPDENGYRGQLDIPFGEPLISATIAGLELRNVRLVE